MARGLILQCDSDLERVGLMAGAVRGACAHCAFAPETLDEVELAVVEAITNVIRHGYGGRPGLPITLSVELEADRLVLTLYDRGDAIPAEQLAAARAGGLPTFDDDMASWPASGMGLGVIFAAVDAVHYESRGGENRLRLEKRYSSSSTS